MVTVKNKQRQLSYLAATIIVIKKSQGFYGYSYCEVDVPLEKRYISPEETTIIIQNVCHRCITLGMPIEYQINEGRKVSAYMYQCRTIIYIFLQYCYSLKSRSSNHSWNLQLLSILIINFKTMTVPWNIASKIIECASIQLKHDRCSTNTLTVPCYVYCSSWRTFTYTQWKIPYI